ncbi:MAG TPA: anti-virulence regulator CigR family protein [Gemmatimonadaceae bacterium]
MTGRLLVAGLLLAMSSQAKAQAGKSKGKPAERSAPATQRASGPGTDVEIRIIREFFGSRPEKPKSLPPGIARNLARGKPLPPGIARKQVPDDLIVLLPARTGTRWLITGGVVLLVDAGDIIVDLIRLVF